MDFAGRRQQLHRPDSADNPESRRREANAGLTIFLVPLKEDCDQKGLEIEEIDKTASGAVDSYELFFQDLRIPEENVIGEIGRGFYQMLDGLNEERLAIAAKCIGLGKAAVEAGVDYANEREVFGHEIGSNQAIQYPLVEAYARVQAAKGMIYNAASTIDDAT